VFRLRARCRRKSQSDLPYAASRVRSLHSFYSRVIQMKPRCYRVLFSARMASFPK
jgi:hypothetical protein